MSKNKIFVVLGLVMIGTVLAGHYDMPGFSAFVKVFAQAVTSEEYVEQYSGEADPDPELKKRELLEKEEDAAVKSGQVKDNVSEAEKSSSVKVKSGALKIAKSPFSRSTYCHAKRFSGYQVLHGIDVSQWQGNINWKKVKASGVSYAIIRIGYRGSDTGSLRPDTRYLSYIKGALKAGIKVGAYIYSQATTPSEARAEANFVLNRIKGYNISMPVVLDYEFYTSSSGRLYRAHLTKREATQVCKAFCNTVENAGYTPMVYGNVDMLSNHLYGEEVADYGMVWLANFGKNNGKDRRFATSYTGTYSFWQYTSRGKVPGISGYVDCNFWYKHNEATGISITDDAVSMLSNTQAYLYHSLTPAGCKDNIKWTSSKPSVAYVKDGTVYGVSEGETVITATTSTGASDSCKIRVSENMNHYEISSISEKSYTGLEQTPEITVRSKTPIATKGTLKKGTSIFSGPGTSYDLVQVCSKKTTVRIIAEEGEYYALQVTAAGQNEYGYCKKSACSAQKEYKQLQKERDYNVKYTSNLEAGTALVEASGSDDSGYQGTISQIFTIAKTPVSKAKVSSISNLPAKTSGQTPHVKVTLKQYNLVEGKDYSVTPVGTLSDSNTPGNTMAQLKISGKGNFTGETYVSYSVCDSDISYVDEIPAQTYTGQALCPKLTVHAGDGRILEEGKDYQVEYSNNIETGDGCAKIVLTNDTLHTPVLVYFEIVPRNIEKTVVTAQDSAFQKSSLQTGITVKDGDYTLVPDVDYNVTYENHYHAGTAQAVITGIGHYQGSKMQNFNIAPAPLDQLVCTVKKKQYYKNGPVTPDVTVKDQEDTLIRNRDYILTYSSNKKRGTASVTVIGNGDYTGSRTLTYNIVKMPISKCKIGKIKNVKYKGHTVKPSVSLRNGGKKLKKGRDYTLRYGKNKKVGKGSVTIIGKGNYSGKKVVNFRIVR